MGVSFRSRDALAPLAPHQPRRCARFFRRAGARRRGRRSGSSSRRRFAPQRDPAWTLVPKVDSDGNETSGIRLPPIGAPIGSYTGWNLYKSPFTEGALCDRDGSFFAFARTKAEREQAGDGRPSLEERYGNRAGCVAQVKALAEKLVTQRLLLSEDVQRYVEWAEKNSPFPGLQSSGQ
jgi:alpha/beta hydrolase family protein